MIAKACHRNAALIIVESMRRITLLVGVVLELIPARMVVRAFAGLTRPYYGASVIALVVFYGCMLAGVAYQRKHGRLGGYFAFWGAMQPVIIAGVIGFFGPFAYAAVTHTTPGNLAPIWGVLIMIVGSIAAVGIGLIAYGAQPTRTRASGPP